VYKRQEIQTTQGLNDHGFFTVNQIPFIDQEEGKLRSIDIKASMADLDDITKSPNKRASLYIECKKSHDSKLVFHRGKALSSFVKQVSALPERSVLSYTSSVWNRFDDVANTYHVIRGHDFFVDAYMKVLKSIKYYEKFIEWESHLVIPIVIFDGTICEYSIDDGQPTLKDLGIVHYMSNGLSIDPIPTMIDVVRLDAFPEYLELLKHIYSRLPRRTYTM